MYKITIQSLECSLGMERIDFPLGRRHYITSSSQMTVKRANNKIDEII